MDEYKERNRKIQEEHLQGKNLYQLSKEYGVCVERIRTICKQQLRKEKRDKNELFVLLFSLTDNEQLATKAYIRRYRMYRYFFSEENGVLFKSGYEGSLEENVRDCKWNPVEYKELKNNLVEISEKQADDKIKEIEGDEYDLVDGYVLCDFSGEV